MLGNRERAIDAAMMVFLRHHDLPLQERLDCAIVAYSEFMSVVQAIDVLSDMAMVEWPPEEDE